MSDDVAKMITLITILALILAHWAWNDWCSIKRRTSADKLKLNHTLEALESRVRSLEKQND